MARRKTMNLAYLPLLMAFWKGGALYLCSKRTADVLRFRYAACCWTDGSL